MAKKIVIATRLHLGNASSAPSESKLQDILKNFERLGDLVEDFIPVIAVDATPKIEKYDYVQAIRSLLPKKSKIEILPVTPWGKFVPALNALVLYATRIEEADKIMFVSAEVRVSIKTIETLCQHLDNDENVIVAGAAMNGHLYAGKDMLVELNGRTTPWNTMAIWNLKKLSLTGFVPCSDLGFSAGVEECAAIAILQKLFPSSVAKLVQLDDVAWNEIFEDEERRKWHEQKMKSKVERPKQQLEKLQLSGTVFHC